MTKEKELALDRLIDTWRVHFKVLGPNHKLIRATEDYLECPTAEIAEPFHFERGQLYRIHDPLSDVPFIVFATSTSVVDEYGYTWTLAEAQELVADETWKLPERIEQCSS